MRESATYAFQGRLCRCAGLCIGLLGIRLWPCIDLYQYELLKAKKNSQVAEVVCIVMG